MLGLGQFPNIALIALLCSTITAIKKCKLRDLWPCPYKWEDWLEFGSIKVSCLIVWTWSVHTMSQTPSLSKETPCPSQCRSTAARSSLIWQQTELFVTGSHLDSVAITKLCLQLAGWWAACFHRKQLATWYICLSNLHLWWGLKLHPWLRMPATDAAFEPVKDQPATEHLSSLHVLDERLKLVCTWNSKLF